MDKIKNEISIVGLTEYEAYTILFDLQEDIKYRAREIMSGLDTGDIDAENLIVCANDLAEVLAVYQKVDSQIKKYTNKEPEQESEKVDPIAPYMPEFNINDLTSEK